MNNFNLDNINLNKVITIMVMIIVVFALIVFIGKAKGATIVLNGDEEIVIYEYDKYDDPGYEIKNGNDGYYVNVNSNLNTNKKGIYYIRYLLYDRGGVAISEAIRKVIVLQDNTSSVTVTLNGDEEEYFFVGDYIDHGVSAYQRNTDISKAVIVENNVLGDTVGDYKVKYLYDRGNNYIELTRTVHIVDYKIDASADFDNRKLTLVIDVPNFDYIQLPNGNKEYSTKILYNYNKVDVYEFDIFLKSGSHKKYEVDINTIDKEGPEGTCTLTHENGKTTITMNVTDKSGISKFSFNGLDFYTNTTSLNTMVANVTVKAYDKSNNVSEIKCKSEYGTAFRTFDTTAKGNINGKLGYIKYPTNVNLDNKELDELMQSYGYRTRDAVAAAAVYLANYKYNIPYFFGGKWSHKGLNPDWGKKQKHTVDKPCGKPLASDHSACEWGLDCSGYTAWAYAQAGFTLAEIRQEGQTEGMWGPLFDARKHVFAFSSNNASLINQIKPGDIVHRPGHVGIVIGIDVSTIQVAEMSGPIIIDIINKSNGASINGQSSFTDFLLMDDYFKLYGNKN